MARDRVHLGRAGAEIRPRRLDERRAGPDHVVVDDDLLAPHVGIHARHREPARLRVAALVDERRLDVEITREALHPLRAPRIARAENERPTGHALLDLLGDDRRAVDVPREHAIVEIELDAVGVKVEQEHPRAALGRRDRRKQTRARLGDDHLPGPHRTLHRLVAEVRNHDRERTRSRARDPGSQVEHLEPIDIGGGSAENHHVATPEVGLDPQVTLPVRKVLSLGLAVLEVPVRQKARREILVRGDAEEEPARHRSKLPRSCV